MTDTIAVVAADPGRPGGGCDAPAPGDQDQATSRSARSSASGERDREHQRPIPPRDRAGGHFPSDQAALKCLYLVTRSVGPDRQGQGTMGDEVEARFERVRHHLRRPDPSGR